MYLGYIIILIMEKKECKHLKENNYCDFYKEQHSDNFIQNVCKNEKTECEKE